jgi:hypothetical protein
LDGHGKHEFAGGAFYFSCHTDGRVATREIAGHSLELLGPSPTSILAVGERKTDIFEFFCRVWHDDSSRTADGTIWLRTEASIERFVISRRRRDGGPHFDAFDDYSLGKLDAGRGLRVGLTPAANSLERRMRHLLERLACYMSTALVCVARRCVAASRHDVGRRSRTGRQSTNCAPPLRRSRVACNGCWVH